MPETSLKGSVFVMMLFDVCEEIRLEELRQSIGAQTVELPSKTRAPEHIRFERPPVVEPLETSILKGGNWRTGKSSTTTTAWSA